MKRGICDKYNRFDVYEERHILPKSTFGESGEIAKLCPNCHRKYHEFLGNENLKNPEPVFHFAAFCK